MEKSTVTERSAIAGRRVPNGGRGCGGRTRTDKYKRGGVGVVGTSKDRVRDFREGLSEENKKAAAKEVSTAHND